MLILHKVTVGILALHYVTNHPAEKELGVKAPPADQRNPSTSSVFPGTTYQASVNSDRTGQTRVWASDQYGDEEVIAAPDRIFVSTSFEVGTSPCLLFWLIPSLPETTEDFSSLAHSISYSSIALMNNPRTTMFDFTCGRVKRVIRSDMRCFRS
jgi:hypothetical protein